MRKVLLFTLFAIAFNFSASAQFGTCMPDSLYADSTFGVYPVPYDSTTMMGGITTSACINKPYEFLLTAVIPETIEFNGFNVGLIKVSIPATDGVMGLPSGITYACNPPTCEFEANSQGCVILYGMADATNDIGTYPLALELTAETVIGTIMESYPGTLFPGSYDLVLEEESSMNCFVSTTNTNDILSSVGMRNVPNPFGDFTTIEIESGLNQEVRFVVYDVFGKEIHTEQVNLFEGANTIDFDATNLVSGIYIYSLQKNGQALTKRMVVSK